MSYPRPAEDLVPLAAAGAVPFTALVLLHELTGVLIIGNGLRAGRVLHFSSVPPPDGAVDAELLPHGTPLGVGTGGGRGRRAAATIAAVALVFGLGGGHYHTVRVSRTNRYPSWVKAAQPVFWKMH